MKITLIAGAALLSLAMLAPVHAADDSTYQGLGGQQGIKNIVTTLIQERSAHQGIGADGILA
jgi:hypothetical protein